MKHELKTDPTVFDAVDRGDKNFEIRFNDRDYQVGDTLHLRKTRYAGAEMAAGAPLDYTGDYCLARVTYVLRGPIYGLEDGWCILSMGELALTMPPGGKE